MSSEIIYLFRGAAHSNPNFMPVGDGWKKKIKRK